MLTKDLSNSGQHTFILSPEQVKGISDIIQFQIDAHQVLEYAFSNVLLGLSAVLDFHPAQRRCDEWCKLDRGPPTDLLACPPTHELAMKDKRFEEEIYSYPALEYYHPGAGDSYRQRKINSTGAGQQCVYQATGGQIQVGAPSGGSADWSSPLKPNDILGHLRDDLLPWTFCCKESTSEKHCSKYYEKRPSDGGNNYIPPAVGSGTGDPHMTTFDRIRYDFMGYGEFWAIKSQHFTLQGRMEPYTAGKKQSKVTHFTAFVMDDGETRVQIDGGSPPVYRINGKIINFVTSTNKLVEGDAKLVRDSGRLTVSYSSGFSMEITGSKWLSILVTASSNHKGQLSGLLGDFDGIGENDFTSSNETLLPRNSTMYDVHSSFGLSWMISKEESLFVYAEGKSYETYRHPEHLPNFKVPDLASVPDNIKKMCSGSRNCLYNYASTGDSKVAEQSKVEEEELTDVMEQLEKQVPLCPPITHANITNGFVVVTNYFVGSFLQIKCNEGFKLVGDGRIYCMRNVGSEPRWSRNIPSCTPLKSLL